MASGNSGGYPVALGYAAATVIVRYVIREDPPSLISIRA